MTLNDLKEKVIKWGHDRKIIDFKNSRKQFLKCVSEFGELCDEIIKDNSKQNLKLEIGDVLVSSIILAENQKCDIIWAKSSSFDEALVLDLYQAMSFSMKRNHNIETYIAQLIGQMRSIAKENGFTLFDCLNSAYEKIKDRKGTTKNGVFMKNKEI